MAILDPDVPRSSALAAKVAALIIVVAIAIPVAAVSLDAGAAAASAGDSAAALADSPLQAAPGPSREALPPALSPEAGLSRGPGSNGTSIVATPAPPQAVDAGPVSRLSAVLDVA